MPVRQSTVNSLIARSIENAVAPVARKTMHFNKACAYVRWWENQLPRAELAYAVRTQPVKTAIVKGYNKLVDTLNTELNPVERKRKKEWIEQYTREQDERRERRAEAKAKAKQEKKEREHIRKMQRLAH